LEQYEVIDVDNSGGYQATSSACNHTDEQQTTFEVETEVSVC